MNYALTVYPLSNGFQRRLKTAMAAEPTYLSVAELRTLPITGAVRRLRSLRGARLVLPLEDEGSRSILPVLKAIAAVSNARSIEIRYPDLRAEAVTRGQLAGEMASLAAASLATRRDARACATDLKRLLAAPRIDAATGTDGRVLYLNANLWFGLKAGGSVGHVAGVVNALSDRGQEVVYASAGDRTMIREAVPHIALDPPKVFGLPYELNYYRFSRSAVRQLQSESRPRFIYQRMSIGNFSGVELSRHFNVPLVLEYNGSEVWVAKNWGRPLRYGQLASMAEDACLRHAHVVVTISEVLRDELIERGVDPARIVCYPNSIDPTVFDPARFGAGQRQTLRARFNIPSDAVLATFVGTFGQWHGADVLAQGIRRLVEEHRTWLEQSRLHFMLVGDGLKMPIVRETLAGADCSRFVTLTGLVPQAEAPSFLAASDILMSPHVANADGSRFFGSPTKLFEYMAMGKAIVASDLDQIGVVLANSVRAGDLPIDAPAADERRIATLFAPGNLDQMTDAIRFVTDRADWRAALGRNVRSEALARYTWSHHVSAILDRLADVAPARSAR